MELGEIIDQADEFVAFHEEQSGKRLDYTPASLVALDAMLTALFDRRVDPADAGDLVIGAAAYLGEVIRRMLGGSWHDGDGVAEVINPRLQVGSVSLWPVESVMRCIADGPEESLTQYYATLTTLVAPTQADTRYTAVRASA